MKTWFGVVSMLFYLIQLVFYRSCNLTDIPLSNRLNIIFLHIKHIIDRDSNDSLSSLDQQSKIVQNATAVLMESFFVLFYRKSS